MKKEYDIIIAGGGIIGSVMALALVENGLTVALVDETSQKIKRKDKFDGRAYAISTTTVQMLSILGLWQDIEGSAQKILDMKVSDGIAGRGASPFYMHFDHNDLEFGPIGYMVEDRILKRTLLQKVLHNNKITKVFGSRIINHVVNVNCVGAHLENGLVISGKLLIGADGRKSAVGERSRIKRNVFDYRQTSIVCAVSHERHHSGEAHQFFMPSGPLAILPLQNNISSIVWTEKNQKADYLRYQAEADFLKELKLRFGSFRGEISLESKPYFFPLSLSISTSLISERIALVGDAAHSVHPIAGQGLNLGMRDVASLAEIVILARRRGEDYGKKYALERYSAWREFDRTTLYSFTHIVNKTFSNNSILLRTARGIIMSAINNNTSIRTKLIKQASGHGDGLPLLMSGRKI